MIFNQRKTEQPRINFKVMKWCIKEFLKPLCFLSWNLFLYIIVTYKKENWFTQAFSLYYGPDFEHFTRRARLETICCSHMSLLRVSLHISCRNGAWCLSSPEVVTLFKNSEPVGWPGICWMIWCESFAHHRQGD